MYWYNKYSSYNLLLFLKSLPRGGVAGEAQGHVIQICTEIYWKYRRCLLIFTVHLLFIAIFGNFWPISGKQVLDQVIISVFQLIF